MTDTIEIAAFELNSVVVYGYSGVGDPEPEHCESYDVVDMEIYDSNLGGDEITGVIETFTAGQLEAALSFAAGYNSRKTTEHKISEE